MISQQLAARLARRAGLQQRSAKLIDIVESV
jgi:hypothetical protein